jgi:hypothetical protein
MIGKDVVNNEGDSVGVISDVVVEENSFEVDSVVKLEADAKEVAVPLSTMKSINGTFSLPDKRILPEFHRDSSTISLASASWLDAFKPPTQIKLRVDSEPTGATFFAHEEAFGSTEIEGLLNPAYKDTIRLEKQGYKPCQFSDGTYTDPAGTVEYATFRCKLTKQ